MRLAMIFSPAYLLVSQWKYSVFLKTRKNISWLYFEFLLNFYDGKKSSQINAMLLKITYGVTVFALIRYISPQFWSANISHPLIWMVWILVLILSYYIILASEKAKMRKKLPKPDNIFFERVYPRVSKDGKMKMFHSCPQKRIHQTSFSGRILTGKLKFSITNQKFL